MSSRNREDYNMSTTSPSTGQFSVKNGQILDPNSNHFVPSGVDILDSTLGQVVSNAAGGPLLATFPGTNMVRIAMESGYGTLNDPTFTNAIKWLTDKGIVVEIGNYNVTQTEITGQNLTDATNWYAEMAATYKTNPYVWFSSENEPLNGGGGTIGAEQQAVYNAIRATGNNNMISFDLAGGSGTSGMDPAIYASMHNVSWDVHYYNWLSG